MNIRNVIIPALILQAATCGANPPKPPVGVPKDAKHFNGKWYRVYLESTSWRRAKDRSKVLGGQLVVIHDEPTWVFVRELANNLNLWLGATDEETEGLWKWVDGKPVKFTAWHRGEPNHTGHAMHVIGGGWNDLPENEKHPRWKPVGFICEWPHR